jgi:hypothetical protein
LDFFQHDFRRHPHLQQDQGVSQADKAGRELEEAGQDRKPVGNTVPWQQLGGDQKPEAPVKADPAVEFVFFPLLKGIDQLADKDIAQPIVM